MKWQWTRALRVAAIASSIDRKRRGAVAASIQYVPKALGRLLLGIGKAGLGALIAPVASKPGQRLMFQGVRSLASAVGSTMGLLNVTPQPYKVVE